MFFCLCHVAKWRHSSVCSVFTVQVMWVLCIKWKCCASFAFYWNCIIIHINIWVPPYLTTTCAVYSLYDEIMPFIFNLFILTKILSIADELNVIMSNFKRCTDSFKKQHIQNTSIPIHSELCNLIRADKIYQFSSFGLMWNVFEIWIKWTFYTFHWTGKTIAIWFTKLLMNGNCPTATIWNK